MKMMFFIVGCFLLLSMGCSHFKMETPRESQANPTAPEVYDEDILKNRGKIK